MSRVRVCLFVLFLVLNIAVQFGDCEDTTSTTDTINTTNTTVDCKQVPPGSNETHLTRIEQFLKTFEDFKKIVTKPKRFFPTFPNIFHKRNSQNDEVPVKSFSASIQEFKEQMLSPHFQMIFPGTLWCGDGDKAKDESDLGTFNETDACCRAHDHCKNSMPAGETEANLKNTGLFTRSACTCDHAFIKCLKNAKSALAKGIGITYFNILKPQCFQCVCPTDNCNASNSSSECKDQCSKYIWVDNQKW